MAEQRTYGGYIYERSSPGEPWRRVAAAQSSAPTTVAPNPGRVEGSALDNRRKGAEASITEATAPAVISKADSDAAIAAANAVKARADADAALKGAAAAPNPEMNLIKRGLATDSVLGAIGTARSQIGRGWATGNVAGTPTFQGIPFVGQNSADLAATLEGISGSIMKDTVEAMKAASATGATGLGALTEGEARRLVSAVAALKQSQSVGALKDNLARVERHYRNSLALLNNEDPRLPEVAAKYGIVDADAAAARTPPGGNEPPAKRELTSEGKFEKDAALSGANANVRGMIRAGSSAADIRAYLNTLKPGLGDSVSNVEQAVDFANQNPGKEEQWLNVDVEKQWVPNSGLTRTLGDIGMSPVGASLIGAADTASLGALDNLTGNPAMTRAVMEGVSEENPNAYLLGQVAGGVTTGLGAEGLLARAGLNAGRSARVGEVAYGAGYGAGSADEPGDSRVAQALLGGGAALVGGEAVRLAARGVGRGIAGINDVGTRLLHNSGVRMTPGQILGGGLKRAEDRLAGLPVVGDMITTARREGIEDFNRAAMGEAIAPIGAEAPAQIGEAGVLSNQQAVSDAYSNALSGSQVVPDPQFEEDMIAAVSGLRDIPRVGGEVVDTVQGIVNPTYFNEAGALPGTNMQPMIQELRGLRSGYASDPLGNRVAGGISDVEDAVTGMFERQAPDVMPAYTNANTAYRNQSIIDDAVLRALNNGGVFTPAQLGTAAKQGTVKFGGKRAAARGDRPFADLQRAGQDVLPSEIPDSGTAGRLVIPALIGATAGGGSYAAQEGEAADRAPGALTTATVASLLAAAPYSRPARAALQEALLAERPEMMMRFGNTLLDQQRIAGLLAAPAAVSYAVE